MSGYAKLSSTLVLSTVWREPHTVRIVWITMLALADAGGYVAASLPGLADAARVTLQECEEALACFQRPDPYSRSKAHEGRRVEEADGGWRLLNYEFYRAGRDPEARRRQNREAQSRHRQGQVVSHGKPQSAARKPKSAQAEAEAEAEAKETTAEAVVGDRARAKIAKAPKLTKWTRVPTDWEPKPEHHLLATELGVDFALELAKCRDHEYQRPKSDPDAAFRTWLRNAKKFGSASQQSLNRGADMAARQLQKARDRLEREGATL